MSKLTQQGAQLFLEELLALTRKHNISIDSSVDGACLYPITKRSQNCGYWLDMQLGYRFFFEELGPDEILWLRVNPQAVLAFPSMALPFVPKNQRIDIAFKYLNAVWGNEGACDSCGWHALITEHSTLNDDEDVKEALAGDGKIKIYCQNREMGEDPVGHHGSIIQLPKELLDASHPEKTGYVLESRKTLSDGASAEEDASTAYLSQAAT